MSIATEITRIQSDRDLLRTKAIELKLSTKADVDTISKAITTTSNLDDLASAFDSIANQGSVSTSVKEGETYTIPKGYHDGTGTVSGVAGGGNYSLQSKTVTPTKATSRLLPMRAITALVMLRSMPFPILIKMLRVLLLQQEMCLPEKLLSTRPASRSQVPCLIMVP